MSDAGFAYEARTPFERHVAETLERLVALAQCGAQPGTLTPEEARMLWQAASRTPGTIASEPLESALAKLLPIAEADGARRKYIGNGCLWVRNQPAPRSGT